MNGSFREFQNLLQTSEIGRGFNRSPQHLLQPIGRTLPMQKPSADDQRRS